MKNRNIERKKNGKTERYKGIKERDKEKLYKDKKTEIKKNRNIEKNKNVKVQR